MQEEAILLIDGIEQTRFPKGNTNNMLKMYMGTELEGRVRVVTESQLKDQALRQTEAMERLKNRNTDHVHIHPNISSINTPQVYEYSLRIPFKPSINFKGGSMDDLINRIVAHFAEAAKNKTATKQQ